MIVFMDQYNNRDIDGFRKQRQAESGKRHRESLKLFRGKRGQSNIFDSLIALGIGIASLAIVLIVVFLIMSQAKSNTTVAADQNATAAISELQNATDDIPTWIPLIVIALIGAILIGLVGLYRFGRNR